MEKLSCVGDLRRKLWGLMDLCAQPSDSSYPSERRLSINKRSHCVVRGVSAMEWEFEHICLLCSCFQQRLHIVLWGSLWNMWIKLINTRECSLLLSSYFQLYVLRYIPLEIELIMNGLAVNKQADSSIDNIRPWRMGPKWIWFKLEYSTICLKHDQGRFDPLKDRSWFQRNI